MREKRQVVFLTFAKIIFVRKMHDFGELLLGRIFGFSKLDFGFLFWRSALGDKLGGAFSAPVLITGEPGLWPGSPGSGPPG
jgi:hypothetical protein